MPCRSARTFWPLLSSATRHGACCALSAILTATNTQVTVQADEAASERIPCREVRRLSGGEAVRRPHRVWRGILRDMGAFSWLAS